jgi:hypothetical protein
VPEIHAIGATRALHGPVVNCERYCVTLVEGNDLRPRLHARALFREDEFAASEIALWFGEQNRHLNGKHMFTVQILMEAVVVAGAVLEEQRRRSQLARSVASPQEVRVLLWVANLNPHRFVPSIRYWSKPRIQRGTKAANERRERVVEVLVFASTKTVSPHDHPAAED